MSIRNLGDWSALGLDSDPVYADPDAVAEAQTHYQNVATTIGLRKSAGDLHDKLQKAGVRYHDVADQIKTYETPLHGRQTVRRRRQQQELRRRSLHAALGGARLGADSGRGAGDGHRDCGGAGGRARAADGSILGCATSNDPQSRSQLYPDVCDASRSDRREPARRVRHAPGAVRRPEHSRARRVGDRPDAARRRTAVQRVRGADGRYDDGRTERRRRAFLAARHRLPAATRSRRGRQASSTSARNEPCDRLTGCSSHRPHGPSR